MLNKEFSLQFVLLGSLIILSVIFTSGCTSFMSDSNFNNSVNVENLQVNKISSKSTLLNYEIIADITPNKDIPRLIMDVTWYDSNGDYVDNSVFIWDVRNAKSGKTINVRVTDSITQSNIKSAYVTILGGTDKRSFEEKDIIYGQMVNITS